MATSSASSLREVTVNISTELPLTTHPSHFTFLEVSSTQLPPPLLVTVVCTPSLLPMSPDLLLSATYKTDDGIGRFCSVEIVFMISFSRDYASCRGESSITSPFIC